MTEATPSAITAMSGRSPATVASPLLAAKSIERSQALRLPAGMGTTTGSAPLPSAADPLANLGSTMTGEGGGAAERHADMSSKPE